MIKNIAHLVFFLMLSVGVFAASASRSYAQIVTHGATIAKGCVSPKSPGDTTNCDIVVGYNDAAGDTISIDEVWDISDFGGDNVRVPAAGSLPISAVSGNTTCTVAGALPCLIGPAGSTLNGLPGTAASGQVTFNQATYVVQANDPDPLPDQGNAKVHDLCDAPNTSGCNSLSNTIQFTSQTNLILNPQVVTQVHNPSHTDVTNGSVPLGTTVHDNATVSGAGTTPTGTVDFFRYANATCEGSGTLESNDVALVAGVAESSGFVTNAVGGVSYKAHYNGDSNYNPFDGVCEPFSVSKLTPNVTTEVQDPTNTDITGTTVDAGTVVHDKAIVAGTGPTPTGTVDFMRYTNDSCTGTPADTQSNVALDSSANPAWAISNTFATVVGGMSYLAHYDGDGNYDPANGVCEPLTLREVPQGCTLTQGYWKNHEEDWPVASLTLGTVSYTKAQLLSILKQPVKGNGLVSLAHQLIAAKLNIADGASDASIASSISSADVMIGSLSIPPVGSSKLATSSTSSLVSALDNFNTGVTGPGHCSE